MLLLFAVVFGLCGCSSHGYVSSPSEPTSSMVEPSSDVEPEDPSAPSIPDDPKVYEASDVAEYFNAKGESEGIYVSYIEEKEYWYLHYIGEESTDESKENLSLGISSFLDYIPLYGEGGYLFRYLSKYVTEPETYFIYVAVSSNWFAACSIYSYIEDEHLITDVIIYDGQNGLYFEK